LINDESFFIFATNNVASYFCQMCLPSAVDTVDLLVLDVAITVATFGKLWQVHKVSAK
jgi:hypothetical protein